MQKTAKQQQNSLNELNISTLVYIKVQLEKIRIKFRIPVGSNIIFSQNDVIPISEGYHTRYISQIDLKGELAEELVAGDMGEEISVKGLKAEELIKLLAGLEGITKREQFEIQ
jgi:hypothetical protein